MSRRAEIAVGLISPIIGNITSLQFALTAIVGGWLIISGTHVITIGSLVAFLQLSKVESFNDYMSSGKFIYEGEC